MWLYYIWIQIQNNTKKKMCVCIYIYILNSTCVGVRACVRAGVSVWVSGWMWVWMCGCVISLWPISHTYHSRYNQSSGFYPAIRYQFWGSYRSWSGQSVCNLCYRTVDPSQLGHCDPHVPGSYQALDSWQLWRVELLKWHLKMKMEIRPFQKPPNIRMKAIV